MKHFSNRLISYTNILFLDLRRAVCSYRFIGAVLFMLVWMIVNIAYELTHYDSALHSGSVYLLRTALDGSNMGPVLLVIAAIPYATMYLTEKESGFYREIRRRIGICTYSISKVLSTFFSAFIMAFVCIALFLVLLTLLGVPHIPPDESTAVYYEGLSITKGVEWYYVVKTTLIGLVCGFSGVFALFISRYVSNPYAAILSPMIGYYLWNSILNLIHPLAPSSVVWQMISPHNLFFAQVWLGSSFASFLWTSFFLLLSTVCLGIQFVKKLCLEVSI